MDFKQSNEEPSVYENLYTFYRRKDYALPRQIAYAQEALWKDLSVKAGTLNTLNVEGFYPQVRPADLLSHAGPGHPLGVLHQTPGG